MDIIKKLKSRAPVSLKKRFNILRYETLPTIKMSFERMLHQPRLPKNPDGKILIHLGSGDQDDKRFINIDSIPFKHVHFVHDVTKLPMFHDNRADLVYASHVLEHTSYKYLVETLREWHRILKPGGILRISVPDFDNILNIYKSENNSIEMIEGPLMGGQNYRYNFHMAVFNETYLTNALLKAGFREVRGWDPDTAEYYTFSDWANRQLYGKYHLSLNLEAIK